MAEIDQDDMSPGLSAFIFAFLGAGLLVIGFLVSLIFWPAGLLMIGIGGLAILSSPVVWAVMRFGDTDVDEDDAAPS
ncbi:hypothetical protein [Natronobacterium gregoryi]|uniref:Uncharacterized protein n=2 Tax=Natronobacterium gregoryi TaxID=44930 RepID=L0AJ06_NATGS|nr:hypothetical protein [Natronobacterium gregoryi]AFZ73045.1 hypothetical protein Natgr_1860 [Natronobacterium gregoryi SP2]ELY70849.1 hypothetical protein C490_06147 [Natronobacterium gregoryi SP2]PLK20430.1 hypothetical protein CYV19_09895 [Natronobacterium gregoryi SP2]SFI62875.1 hypothetical protein SAMN05443661_102221 [Natronobacterium gregoryi]